MVTRPFSPRSKCTPSIVPCAPMRSASGARVKPFEGEVARDHSVWPEHHVFGCADAAFAGFGFHEADVCIW